MRRTLKGFGIVLKGVFSSKSCRIQTCFRINLNSTIKTSSDYFIGVVKKLKSLTYLLEILRGDILVHSQDVQTSILHLITYLEDSY